MLDASEVDDLKIDTLAGDLRDAMLMRIRDMKRPWTMLTQEEQTILANGLDLQARDLVRSTVRLFTNFEWPRAAVTLGEVKIKGEKGIEAKITCPNLEVYRTVLGEHVGHQVLILMVDSDEFMGERAPAAIDPDQPDLELDAEDNGD